MSNFINQQLANVLNEKMTGIGTVENAELERDSIKLRLNLDGETEPVDFHVSGIKWSTGDGKMHIHFETATASKPWMQGLLNIAAKQSNNCISVPDRLTLAPLKMILRRA